MKKIITLMLLLLSPFCAQTMDCLLGDKFQFVEWPKTAAQLSPRMEKIRGSLGGSLLEALLQKEAELNPNNQDAPALLEKLRNSYDLRQRTLFWLEVQKSVSAEAKSATLSRIASIQEHEKLENFESAHE
jgi:hypothetical protein